MNAPQKRNAVSNEELAKLIRTVSADVDNANPGTIAETVKVLREHVEPGCHVGAGDKMDSTDEGYRLQLEWFAGQLLSMVDNQQWFGINSWINCTDKYTAPAAITGNRP